MAKVNSSFAAHSWVTGLGGSRRSERSDGIEFAKEAQQFDDNLWGQSLRAEPVGDRMQSSASQNAVVGVGQYAKQVVAPNAVDGLEVCQPARGETVKVDVGATGGGFEHVDCRVGSTLCSDTLDSGCSALIRCSKVLALPLGVGPPSVGEGE